MDTSETYIKMCEKAEEIQSSHGIDFDDYAFAKWGIECERAYVAINSAGSNDPAHWSTPIWLPRQDQLQEMLPQDLPSNRIKVMLAAKFAHFVALERKYDASWEQLWLAFIMKEKYSKLWTGTDWEVRRTISSVTGLPV